MAVIVYLYDVDVIKGSRKGCTFDVSQASWIVKRKPSPTNPNTNPRNKVRALLKDTNAYFWALTHNQRVAWAGWAAANNITGPYFADGFQAACAAFFSVQLNARIAGDPFYIPPPGNLPLAGVNFTNLIRIDKDTVQATFNPSPAGANNRIYLRQAVPGPGVRRWAPFDGYIAQYSGKNPNSTFDFATKFQHLTGWHGRYWLGTQEDTGRRSAETLFDL